MTVIYDTFPCCFGDLVIAAINDVPCFVGIGWDCYETIKKKFSAHNPKPGNINKKIVEKILDMVENTLSDDPALEVYLWGSDFQIKVWETLIYDVKYGQTITYKQIAEKIGKPKSYRAVANACGENPLCIVIPCHRVIHSNGSIEGYRYGNDIKKKLLSREKFTRI